MEADVLVIGGGPAGVVTSVTAKKYNPDKSVVLVRESEKAVIPCAIPYIFSRLDAVEKIRMPDTPLENSGVEIVIGHATGIDTKEKRVFLEGGKEILYEKLVLATGSRPVIPGIEGVNKEGVWHIEKNMEYLEQLRKHVLSCENVVIIGGGFIGVEIAEELSALPEKKVTVVERKDRLLSPAFDPEFSALVRKKLESLGVEVRTGTEVRRITGEKKVDGLELANGEVLPAECVIISAGARPRAELAEQAGIRTGNYGGIWVDEYMRTSAESVYAVGDCAETRDFFTGKHIPVMLASTATTEARILGANLYSIKILRENKGTLGSFSTSIANTVFASTGMTEERARKEGFEVVTGESEAPNRHPAQLPGSGSVKIKLVFSAADGRLVGAQLSGPESVAELVNMIAMAIQRGVTVYDFDSLHISTHPLLTPPPTAYPLVTAALSAMSKLRSGR